MHNTLHPDVKGFIDYKDSVCIKGWAFHTKYLNCKLRVHSEPIITTDRLDVLKYYNTFFPDKMVTLSCGFEVGIGMIEMFFEEKWNVIFDLQKIELNINYPSFLVVDNFYKDVNKVRELALSNTFVSNLKYHKGKRTDEVFLFDGIKEQFEHLLQKKIKNWNQPPNGCFQYCIGGDQLVYHVDLQQYAGIIFLTPDAPPEAGTTFYRSKHTKCMHVKDDYDIVFKNGFLDATEFEKVDVIGNVYNRLVLFNAQMIHAASVYFGNIIQNGRLFQMFFFDIE